MCGSPRAAALPFYSCTVKGGGLGAEKSVRSQPGGVWRGGPLQGGLRGQAVRHTVTSLFTMKYIMQICKVLVKNVLSERARRHRALIFLE